MMTADRRLRDMPADGRKKQDRKDAQLIIRINKADRDAFLDLCETLDTSAAREIRRFIREFTLSHRSAADESGADHDSTAKEPDTWPRKQKSRNSKKK
jgi:23S rRNA C2498 (ribose-2'-O)-methylase RlmM